MWGGGSIRIIRFRAMNIKLSHRANGAGICFNPSSRLECIRECEIPSTTAFHRISIGAHDCIRKHVRSAGRANPSSSAAVCHILDEKSVRHHAECEFGGGVFLCTRKSSWQQQCLSRCGHRHIRDELIGQISMNLVRSMSVATFASDTRLQKRTVDGNASEREWTRKIKRV